MPSNTGPGRRPSMTIALAGGGAVWTGCWADWARVSEAEAGRLGDGAAIVAAHPASTAPATIPVISLAVRTVALRSIGSPRIPRVRLSFAAERLQRWDPIASARLTPRARYPAE